MSAKHRLDEGEVDSTLMVGREVELDRATIARYRLDCFAVTGVRN